VAAEVEEDMVAVVVGAAMEEAVVVGMGRRLVLEQEELLVERACGNARRRPSLPIVVVA
jgi:hypothetical protein